MSDKFMPFKKEIAELVGKTAKTAMEKLLDNIAKVSDEIKEETKDMVLVFIPEKGFCYIPKDCIVDREVTEKEKNEFMSKLMGGLK